jgi:hypothetical protein
VVRRALLLDPDPELLPKGLVRLLLVVEVMLECLRVEEELVEELSRLLLLGPSAVLERLREEEGRLLLLLGISLFLRLLLLGLLLLPLAGVELPVLRLRDAALVAVGANKRLVTDGFLDLRGVLLTGAAAAAAASEEGDRSTIII